jgi:hypothetical protein
MCRQLTLVALVLVLGLASHVGDASPVAGGPAPGSLFLYPERIPLEACGWPPETAHS